MLRLPISSLLVSLCLTLPMQKQSRNIQKHTRHVDDDIPIYTCHSQPMIGPAWPTVQAIYTEATSIRARLIPNPNIQPPPLSLTTPFGIPQRNRNKNKLSIIIPATFNISGLAPVPRETYLAAFGVQGNVRGSSGLLEMPPLMQVYIPSLRLRGASFFASLGVRVRICLRIAFFVHIDSGYEPVSVMY
ncbi:hypothetical protein EJ02DRAFT_513882 [Clathrospora elynae]|uniref:Uncharacterized protein n=1 Tax=Clathrospora elynae TaxID=706981 RepID=A0A6A5SH43_9PLEO|nr:hypothetical protein EJ02DRAFT_513882 [Clathrospora elynae]